MEASFKKSYASLGADRLVLLWLGVWWIANLVQAGFTELANDEAYYHMFAERLAWGYFDHPPVTALLVWAGERLFGGELGVRFFFTVLQPLYLWILWRLIRPADAGRRDAALFVVVSAATLMLQLYGFIAVPDGPLMFTTALFLLTFKWFSENRRRAWLWMGIAMALMAYSKYHGALVVLFALAANPRQLLRPALYSSGAVALLLLVPHLVWQYEHDWASFAYHLSGRNSVFRPGYVVEFLANVLVVFNPFFVPLYVQAWRKVKPQTPVGRALKLLPVAFIVFFMLSSLRGYVQPQWVIVSCFGLVCVLFAYARRHPRTRRYVMRAGGVTVAEDWGSDEADRDGAVTLHIPEEHFFPWSPDTPFLYDLTVGTTQGEEEQRDTVHSYFALRKWSCAPDAHGIMRFCLNGKPILLNGLLDQGYWPEGLYTPPSDGAVVRELQTIKELGFNLLRKHAKIEPQRWYYHCDKLGLIVWQDMVNGGGPYKLWFVTYLTNVFQPLLHRLPDARPLWGLLGRETEAGREEYARELEATVKALQCHPCVGCWVPFNEGWGQFDAARIAKMVAKKDPTRPVDHASGWFDQKGGDFRSIHNYFRPLQVKLDGKRAFVISEYGGYACHIAGHSSVNRVYGYQKYDTPEEMAAALKQLFSRQLFPLISKGLSGAVYTQLSDVEEEVNGLVTYDRRVVKLPVGHPFAAPSSFAAPYSHGNKPE